MKGKYVLLTLLMSLVITSCDKEVLSDIRLSKYYINGELYREYFYDEKGRNFKEIIYEL